MYYSASINVAGHTSFFNNSADDVGGKHSLKIAHAMGNYAAGLFVTQGYCTHVAAETWYDRGGTFWLKRVLNDGDP